MINVKNNGEFALTTSYSWHKGFYKETNFENVLYDIKYTDFFQDINDEEFPYDMAYYLLDGACHLFALSLNKILNYNIYIIEGIRDSSFHAFCQLYKDGIWYYVDARGITSSFNEFAYGIKKFVNNEFIIRPVNSKDFEEWKQDDNFYEEGCAFAEAIINSYINYYTL